MKHNGAIKQNIDKTSVFLNNSSIYARQLRSIKWTNPKLSQPVLVVAYLGQLSTLHLKSEKII